MSSSKPKIQPPVPPPPVPTIDDASKARDDSDALRKRRGRAASILAGKTSESTSKYQSGAKTLTGG